jgi:nucleoside-diphosphate-sugar epimerase
LADNSELAAQDPTTEPELDARLSVPSPELVRDLAALDGDIVVLGAGGKMGPSLCTLARRALDEAGQRDRQILAVSRWSDAAAEAKLTAAGVQTVKADVSMDADLSALPDAANVIYMIGAKFGTSGKAYEAWAINTVLPAVVARRYAGSRIAAFSTGNVYPLVEVASGGCRETDPVGPIGDYAMSCLGRERALESISRAHDTPTVLIRLNYAIEPRYGVLADIALKVRDGKPVDLANGHVNVVSQRYANEVALRSLAHASAPPLVLNLTGPETASVRRIAERFGEFLGVTPKFSGEEAPTALLSNAGECFRLFGYPDLSLDRLIEQQARWISAGGVQWDKATKFERRDGKF